MNLHVAEADTPQKSGGLNVSPPYASPIAFLSEPSEVLIGDKSPAGACGSFQGSASSLPDVGQPRRSEIRRIMRVNPKNDGGIPDRHGNAYVLRIIRLNADAPE